MTSRWVKLNLRDLCVEISNLGGATYRQKRESRARRVLIPYKEQDYKRVLPNTCQEILNTGDDSVMTYGCASLFLNKSNLSDQGKIQGG